MAFFEAGSSGVLLASSMTTSTSLERFSDHRAPRTWLQLVTTVLAVAGDGVLLPRGGPGCAFCDPGDSLGSVIFQKRLARTDVREKAVISTAAWSNQISRELLTIKKLTPQRPWELRSDRLLKRRLPAQNRRAIQLSAALSFLIVSRFCSHSWRILVGFGGCRPGEEIAHGIYSLYWLIHTQRLLWPLTTLGRTSTTTAGDGLSVTGGLTCLATNGDPSGDRPLHCRRSEEAWNSASQSFGYGGRRIRID